MYLIDTHVLLWLLSDQDKLSATAKIILQEEELFISMASLSCCDSLVKTTAPAPSNIFPRRVPSCLPLLRSFTDVL